MRRSFQLLSRPLCVLVALLGAAGHLMASTVDLPRFPSLSPDGRTMVFSWRGDLWSVPSSGGHATRLTSHPGDDLASAWSPDGRRIAFESDRDGYTNLFTMAADGTDVRQVTRLDRGVNLGGFGSDDAGEPVLTFAAFLENDLYRSPRPYAVAVDGGPWARMHDAFGSEPVVSPDGRFVLFTRGGSSWDRRHYRGPDDRDVWVLDRTDGSFRQLTDWTGNDGKARWVGNDTVLFLSDRLDDTVNVFRMSLAEGDRSAQPLTAFEDSDVVDFAVSEDGRRLVVHAWDALHGLDLADPDARLERLAITASEDEGDRVEVRNVDRSVTEAQLSPDGKTLAVVAFGDVYVRAVEDKSPLRAVTRTEAREGDIAWSPDGLVLYFVSDIDGVESIHAATVAETRDELRKAAERALDPEADDEPAAGDEPAQKVEPAQEPAAADDGASVGETKGDPASDGADEATDGAAAAKRPAKKEKPKDPRLDPSRWQQAVRFDVAPVVATAAREWRPSPSPDGKHLAFMRGYGDLVVRDLATGDERSLVTGWDAGLEWQWSPDARWIAYAQSDRNFNSDIFVVPADGSAPPANITRHPDNDGRPRWSADGRILVFGSERADEQYDVWRVYLDPALEAKTPLELEQYYKEAVAAAKKRKPLDPPGAKDAKDDEAADGDPDAKDGGKKDSGDGASDGADDDAPKLDLEHAWRRVQRLTRLPGNEGNVEITPGGDRIVFTASDDGGGLFSIKWDGSDQKRLGGSGSVQQVTLTGDRVVVVSGGRATTVKPEGGDSKTIDVDARIVVDRGELSRRKFVELARVLGAQFYHPTMKGLDWTALTDRYLELAGAARTPDEFNWVANRFLGELNASHLGVRAPSPSSPIQLSQGRLGTTHRPVDLDGRVAFEVVAVLPQSPAAKATPAIEPGDAIVAIEFEPFGAEDTIESRLQGRVGEETAVTVVRRLPEGQVAEFTVLLAPASVGEERRLAYDDWQEQARRRVSELSDGRIGYIHVQSMNQPSLDEFERDLFAAAEGKDGLIVDVRNNGGGWTADRLLASIMTQPHAYTVPRGMDPTVTDGYPQDRLFIQRYTLPMSMLCNEKSFSNAEIVSHAFKTLGRGTLVGQQTYGGVISTGGFSLLDGTTVRLPFRGWYLPDGTDMENNGAMPDLVVPQTPEAESANRDEQLETAVRELVGRLG